VLAAVSSTSWPCLYTGRGALERLPQRSQVIHIQLCVIGGNDHSPQPVGSGAEKDHPLDEAARGWVSVRKGAFPMAIYAPGGPTPERNPFRCQIGGRDIHSFSVRAGQTLYVGDGSGLIGRHVGTSPMHVQHHKVIVGSTAKKIVRQDYIAAILVGPVFVTRVVSVGYVVREKIRQLDPKAIQALKLLAEGG
jgi:hypothetical protein